MPPALLPPALLPLNKNKSSLRSVSRTPSNNGSGGKGSLTCGELLALSGALSAALPTHLGIDSRSVHTLYSSLAKGVKHFSAPTLFFSADQAPAGFTNYYSESDSCDSESDWSDEDWKDEGTKQPSLAHRFCSQIRVYIHTDPPASSYEEAGGSPILSTGHSYCYPHQHPQHGHRVP